MQQACDGSSITASNRNTFTKPGDERWLCNNLTRLKVKVRCLKHNSADCHQSCILFCIIYTDRHTHTEKQVDMFHMITMANSQLLRSTAIQRHVSIMMCPNGRLMCTSPHASLSLSCSPLTSCSSSFGDNWAICCLHLVLTTALIRTVELQFGVSVCVSLPPMVPPVTSNSRNSCQQF